MAVNKVADWRIASAKPYITNSGVTKTAGHVGRRHKSLASGLALLWSMLTLKGVHEEMRQVVGLGVILVVAITAYAVTSAVNTKIGYTVVDMQKEVVQLSKQNDELRLNVAELKSPTRIQQIAQDKLGMVLPDAFVYNSKGTTVERDVQVTKRIID